MSLNRGRNFSTVTGNKSAFSGANDVVMNDFWHTVRSKFPSQILLIYTKTWWINAQFLHSNLFSSRSIIPLFSCNVLIIAEPLYRDNIVITGTVSWVLPYHELVTPRRHTTDIKQWIWGGELSLKHVKPERMKPNSAQSCLLLKSIPAQIVIFVQNQSLWPRFTGITRWGDLWHFRNNHIISWNRAFFFFSPSF